MDVFRRITDALGLAAPDWGDAVLRQVVAGRAEELGNRRPEWRERLAAVGRSVSGGLAAGAETELAHALWLMEGAGSWGASEAACRLAEFVSGLSAAEHLDRTPGASYRRPDTGEWVRVTADGLARQPLPGFRVAGTSVWVYPPRTELFDDVFLPAFLGHLYPAFDQEIDAPRLDALTRAAFDSIHEYSQELASGIGRTLSAVALLPPTARALSTNLGLRYPRAVFVSPWSRPSDPHLLASSIAHEYYHQCCWILRADGRLDGVLNPAGRIRSPLSGYDVDTLSMLDGLLIFVSNLDYFNDVLDRRLAAAENVEYIRRRRDVLVEKLPALIRLLEDAVRVGSPAAEFVRVLAEYCQALRIDTQRRTGRFI